MYIVVWIVQTIKSRERILFFPLYRSEFIDKQRRECSLENLPMIFIHTMFSLEETDSFIVLSNTSKRERENQYKKKKWK